MKKRVTLLLLLTAVMAARGSDWPKWRGPHNTGVSLETQWDATALNGIPNIVWRAEIGRGHSGVVIQGDRVFATGNVPRIRGNDTTYVDEVTCLDRASGRTLWKYAYPCDNVNWPGPRATPTVYDKTLFTVSWEGHLYAFDTETGRVRWFHHLVDEGLSGRPNWGFAGSPAVEGDLVVMAAGQRGIAFNRHTGIVVWNNGPGIPTLPTPLIFKANGKAVVALSQRQDYHVLDLATGETLATYPFYQTDIDPIMIDDELFMASAGGCRTLKLKGLEHEVAMENPRARLQAWQNYVIVNGHAYGYFSQGRTQGIQCVDVATGTIKWREPIPGFGSLMAAGDKLIVLTGGGELRIVDADPEKYTLRSSATVLRMADNNGVRGEFQCYCWTQPVFLDGHVYAKNNYGELVSVDMR